MAGIPAGWDARSIADSAGYYERSRPDQTLLYQIIEQHYAVFSALMAKRGRVTVPRKIGAFWMRLSCKIRLNEETLQ